MRLPSKKIHLAGMLEKIKDKSQNLQPKGSLKRAVPVQMFFLLPLALLLALLSALFLDAALASGLTQIQNDLASVAGKRSPSLFIPGAGASLKLAKIKFSSFAVSEKNPTEAEEPKAEAKPIDAFSLVGTIPPVGAWVKVESDTSLVLKDQEFSGYQLEIVESGKILFTRDGENYPLYLVFSLPQEAPKAAEPKSSRRAASKHPGIQNADFDGNEGTITRELLNELLMNPYDEIAKVRLVPSGSGMTIRSMRPDSLLLQLGMKQGDVLTGINGIPIKDVSNLSNAINSMLTGARLDFNVTRSKKPGKLGYVVK